MKKRLLVMILAAVFALSLVACTAPEQSGGTTTTPLTTTTTTEPVTLGSGGNDSPYYSRKFNIDFSVESALVGLADETEYAEWEKSFKSFGGNREQSEFNVYNLIVELNIPRSAVEELSETCRETWGYPYFIEEQIELFYTGTKEEVYAYFANPYAILIGTNVYTPRWLVEQSVDAYREAGITAELLEENFDRVTGPCSEEQRLIVKGKLEQLKAE